MGIKRQKEIHSLIGIEEKKFVQGSPKFGVALGAFGRIERSFGVVEKTLVFMHGLPLFDHSAESLCK